jgi:hypothetical protein
MIALIAVFPVYLVAELNQKTGSIPVNDPSSKSIENTEKTNVQQGLIPAYNELSFSMLKTNTH